MHICNGLRHKLSSLARTLGSWIPNPLKAWMYMRLFCVCVVLCLGSGLETGWSLVQGVHPSVKNDYETEGESLAPNGLEEPLKKRICICKLETSCSSTVRLLSWLRLAMLVAHSLQANAGVIFSNRAWPHASTSSSTCHCWSASRSVLHYVTFLLGQWC
jgi:hypothetical protein